MTGKPPKDMLAWENLGGRVGRALRNGHESFRFVRNGLESFRFKHQTNSASGMGRGMQRRWWGGKGGGPVRRRHGVVGGGGRERLCMFAWRLWECKV